MSFLFIFLQVIEPYFFSYDNKIIEEFFISFINLKTQVT